MTRRESQVSELLVHHVATYLNNESDRTSLLTVTGATISKDLSAATVFVTVFPDTEEERAVSFLKRKERDVRKYLTTHTKMSRVPRIEFSIDYGEKHRQDIDKVSNG